MPRLARPARASAIAALAAIASVGHFLYPVWLAIKTRGKAAPIPPVPEEWPSVTVIVPAYRERAVIAAKVRNALENGYRGPLQVLVVADDPDTAEAARATPADVLDAAGSRQGKAAAVNRALEHAGTELVVLTDANASLRPGSLSALARWFEDPAVGAVAGEKRVLDEAESLYWQFESWLKQRESRLGTTVGLVGEIAALRRSLYKPLPTDVIVDDLWLALDVASAGKRIVYDPTAIASEDGSSTLSEEWERRSRNVAGALDALWRRRRLLVPGEGGIAGQLWGHRLVRLSIGPAAHLALLVVALSSARRSRVAAFFCVGHAAAAVALLRRSKGVPLTRPERLLAQTLFLQAVALRGTIRWLSRDWSSAWHKPERAAPPPEEPRATS